MTAKHSTETAIDKVKTNGSNQPPGFLENLFSSGLILGSSRAIHKRFGLGTQKPSISICNKHAPVNSEMKVGFFQFMVNRLADSLDNP